jgi:hypothetical protein
MPAGRGLQRTPAVTTGPKEPQVRLPTQPPPGSPSGGGPEFESPHPLRPALRAPTPTRWSPHRFDQSWSWRRMLHVVTVAIPREQANHRFTDWPVLSSHPREQPASRVSTSTTCHPILLGRAVRGPASHADGALSRTTPAGLSARLCGCTPRPTWSCRRRRRRGPVTAGATSPNAMGCPGAARGLVLAHAR